MSNKQSSVESDVIEMKELIVHQQLEIKRLQKQVDSLQDSYDKRQEWLSKAKREAGFDDYMSFDNVWKKVLEKYKEVTNETIHRRTIAKHS
jgi:uncharacterized coiled-coil protein SlyX